MENTHFFEFLIDDVIHDVIYLMNLSNEYKATNLIVFQKIMFYFAQKYKITVK